MKVNRAEQRANRGGRTGRRGDPFVSTATMSEVLAAIESIDLDQGWEQVAPALVPLLPRRRPLPSMDPPLTRVLPPGLRIAFGVDVGPALWYVAEMQLEGWAVTPDQVTERAIANVRERAVARTQFGLIHEYVADVPTLAFQSREGWASTLLLMPDQLARVFGDEPALILAPMRDAIFRLPLDVDRDFAAWLHEELCALDMNALDVPPYALVDGELRVDAGSVVIQTGHRH